MIPKIIWSIWVGDSEMSEITKRCLKSHEVKGWKHRMITSDNCFKGNKYLKDCIKSKNWVKMADYLRIYYLYKEGGVYLDADIELLKPLDDLLYNNMFACREDNGFIANSAIGSVKNNPILKDCMEYTLKNFKGSDKFIFESGMGVFTDKVYKNAERVKILSSDYFFPYNHQTGITEFTENTRAYHHFLKSWK